LPEKGASFFSILPSFKLGQEIKAPFKLLNNISNVLSS